MSSDMPLMLDGAMVIAGDVHVGLGDVDVDDVDLFGGPPELAFTAPVPPSKPLQLCIDEQRLRGCCERIAWSKQGTIASIAPDGQSVELRYLRTHPDTAEWALCEPTKYTQFSAPGSTNVWSGGPIVHLSWSTAGHTELAVIDSVGRVSILTFTHNLNRAITTRFWEADPVDDLRAVVGCFWLPPQPASKQSQIILHGPAVRDEHAYRYQKAACTISGPYHPNITKSALLCVTASANLRLFYSQQNGPVQDTSCELENITSADDLVTHAAICTENNRLYIALVTASRQLKVVRADINWNQAHQDKSMPSQGVQFNPTIQPRLAAVTTYLQGDGDASQLDISATHVSHVEILPSAQPPLSPQPAPPLVVTVRNYVPTPTTAHYAPEGQCIINRWELVMDEPQVPLHPAWEQLGFKPPNQGHNPPLDQTRLHRMTPLVLAKIVVAVHVLPHGRALCFVFSDGTLQYRDRVTFDILFHEPSPARLSSLQHAFFQFSDPVPCLGAALSPTNCSFAQICEDGRVQWNGLRYTGPSFTPTGPDANYMSVLAGLTLAITTASTSQALPDDILATARHVTGRPRFPYDWVQEIIRTLNINVDYSEEAHHDQLVKNHFLPLCLSILNHLGFHGQYQPRSFYGKFAMLALNVRNVVIVVTIANNHPPSSLKKLNPLDEPDVVDALAGCVKWTLDLLAYVCDSLFNLLDDPRFLSHLASGNLREMIAYLQEKNDVSLHLILCSSTRGFLSAACRRMSHLDSISARAANFYEQQQQAHTSAHDRSPPPRPAIIASYQRMQQYTSSSLVRVLELDSLLLALGDEIRQMYHRAAAAAAAAQGGGDAQARRLQAQCEQALLLAGTPPSTFQPLLQRFFDTSLRVFRRLADPARLYFADYSVLEVGDDERSLQERRLRRSHLDNFKRVMLLPGGGGEGTGRGNRLGVSSNGNKAVNAYVPSDQLRRCVRCASVMEDIVGSQAYSFVLSQQRRCSCTGSWGLEARSVVFR